MNRMPSLRSNSKTCSHWEFLLGTKAVFNIYISCKPYHFINQCKVCHKMKYGKKTRKHEQVFLNLWPSSWSQRPWFVLTVINFSSRKPLARKFCWMGLWLAEPPSETAVEVQGDSLGKAKQTDLEHLVLFDFSTFDTKNRVSELRGIDVS